MSLTWKDPQPDLSGPDGVADGSDWWADGPVCCERCGEEDIFRNAIAWDLSGETVCDDCAEEIIEDNSQFGMGA